MENILKSSDARAAQLLDQYKSRLPVQSTSTGSWFNVNMGGSELLRAVVHNILTEPLQMGQVINRCVETIMFLKCSKSRIISCGPTDLESTFLAALKTKTDSEIVVHDACGETSSIIAFGQSAATPKRPKIAIVGMAGRFPNAADHEKFWNLLEAGLDVHKKVRLRPKPCSVLELNGCRSPKIASMRRNTTTRRARLVTPATHHLDASSMSQDFSIPASSTCHLAKLYRQIQCID